MSENEQQNEPPTPITTVEPAAPITTAEEVHAVQRGGVVERPPGLDTAYEFAEKQRRSREMVKHNMKIEALSRGAQQPTKGLPTPAEYDAAKVHKDGQGGVAGEYTFKGYSNFAVFCRINRDKIFLDGDSASIEVIKNQVDLFLMAQKNTIGGCGCSKDKRRQTALKVYIETTNVILKNEEVQGRIVGLLNSPSAVVFLEGQKTGASAREEQKPFATILKS